MYQREFDKVLKDRKVPKSLMLFGESHFLIGQYFEIIKSYYSADEVFTFYNFNYNLESARGTISQGSLFSESTLLVIKSEDKISNKDLKILIESIKNSENSYFLYLYYGDNFKDSQKSFLSKDNSANFVRFFNPDFGAIQNIVYSEVKKRGFQISNDGVIQLIHLKNSNLSLILSEIEKLSNYGNKNINLEDILEMVSPSEDVELDKVINYFFNSGDWSRLAQFVDIQNIDEVMVITSMVKFVEDLYLFRSALERGDGTDSISVLGLKLPPHIEREKQQNGQRFNLSQIEKFLTILMEAELRFKSGKVGSKDSFFTETIISIFKIFR